MKGKCPEKTLELSSTVTVSSNAVKASNSSVLSPNVVMLIIIPSIVLGLYAVAVTVWENQYVYTLIDQPLDFPLVMKNWKESEKTVWSSYRPNLYIAMQPMIPKSVSIGLAWFVQRDDDIVLHHECIGGHCLSQQSWKKHDGCSFGQQIITSSEGFLIKSEFISDSQPGYGNTWTLRVTAEPLRKMQRSFLSVIIYVYNEGSGQMDMNGNINKGMVEEIFGHTQEMKEYRIHFPYKFVTKNTAYSFMRTHISSDSNISNILLDSLNQTTAIDMFPSLLHTLSYNMTTAINDQINFIAYQITSLLVVPIEIDTVFESGMYSAAISISGKRFTEMSQIRHAGFDQRFEKTFNLLSKGFSMEDVMMCQSILSGVLGSIKYGQNNNLRVMKGVSVSPKNYFSFPFLSSTTTTNDDIRQFSIIDEGYHQLLILQWNVNITKTVIGHWLDTMNIDGWIPGLWSVVGRVNSNDGDLLDTTLMNAPSFFLTVDNLITRMEKNNEMDYEFLKLVFPRLQIWYDWMNETQAGQIPGTFKWNGRETDPTTMNPETPMSGMWDYPRSSDSPHPEEYHLDLRCWMTVGARVLFRIAELIDEGSSYYSSVYRELTDYKRLDQLHWDNKRKVYCDYGYHNPNIKMARTKSGKIIRKTTGVSSLRYINTLGYVNMFPLLYTILSPDSPKLGYSLKQLHDPSLLWCPYGVRSLAKNDQFYHKSNDPNIKHSYSWRGPVHIHMNYLILKALNHYRHSPGPYAEIADKIYSELRNNLINVVMKEYSRTGFLWSYYDDKTGHGKGTVNSGLSSLILLVMAEIY